MFEFSLSEFLSRNWTQKELVELGKENLRRIIQLLRQIEKDESYDIRIVSKSLNLLMGMNSQALERAADLAIDHATLVSPLPISYGKSARGLESNVRSTYGHTTFKICGDCKHACSWSKNVSCRFYSSLDGDPHGAPYDNPCRLRKPGEVERVIGKLREKNLIELQRQKIEREKTQHWIKRVMTAEEIAESLPLLPIFRKKSFYLFGDRLLVWTGFPIFGKHRNKWAPATFLRHDQSIIVVLDNTLLPPTSYMHKSWIKKEWASRLWYLGINSPFLLRPEEMATLAKLPKEHTLKQLWTEHANTWEEEDPTNASWMKTDSKEFSQSLSEPCILRSAQPNKRMMSAQEALATLRLSTYPESTELVVKAYRLLKGTEKVPEQQLSMAKDTLLVRIYLQHE